ncbi:hypothetical protein Rsub_05439 [Raphidocelis subcapitata]|uniref:cytokinin riboside 5'-monophosphate phosphoribohydrolase n=1 Tax=Raphidocelis subcapitata TaxID=307507 RepID=A0A2V0P4P2_9CHLO|nr:hypothetical protein Rsub_05439 [Raphidocelis subcapitata]|eukprot:GBF92820.1 hypothetical protein Rsub_05439 [Raphidocelis subcapitata]
MELKRACVFCGSRNGARPAYTAAAAALAKEMVRRDVGLVYGGGTVGLMGVIARGVADGLGPGRVLGVIPAALTPREISSEMIGDTRVVDDMHQRKEDFVAGGHLANLVVASDPAELMDSLEDFVAGGHLANLVVASDPAELMDLLAGWRPAVKGLVLSAQQRAAAIGEDVAGHEDRDPETLRLRGSPKDPKAVQRTARQSR